MSTTEQEVPATAWDPAHPIVYPDVQAILRSAAPDTVGSSSNGGLGAFWNLSRDEFIAAKFYNDPLIAPEDELSCCGTPLKNGRSRSARSLLISGLSGQAPFDGTQFKTLPWGGTTLSANDIEAIAAWIDGGCPDAGACTPDSSEGLGRARIRHPNRRSQYLSVPTRRAGAAHEPGLHGTCPDRAVASSIPRPLRPE